MNLQSRSPRFRISIQLQIGRKNVKLNLLKLCEWSLLVLSLVVHLIGLIFELNH